MRKHVTSVAVGFLLVLSWAGATMAQWEPTARLGLSAAPDHYVADIAPTIGEPFTLYVILTGLDDATPPAFELESVTWVIHTVCCGDSPVGVTSLEYAPGVIASGDPYTEIQTDVADCPQDATVLLATVTFDWLLDGDSEFPLSAGALTGALACDGSAHLLQTLVVMVDGHESMPAEPTSWSALKALAGERRRP